MAIDRPTFSESWHRVADLRPRLRSTVHSFRQHFRGQAWHVLQDQASNQFFRLNEPAYHFVGLLDSRRSVAEVWEATQQQLGDDAPTQGEAIQLLGQLYAANLLQGELPADARGMFERYGKRVRREIQGYLKSFLFIRIPLFDPDHILDRWLPVFGWVFSSVGFALWVVLLAVGGAHLAGHTSELLHGARQILDVDNLVLLYLAFAGVKLVHEFGHGFACKRFGRYAGGGEVHTLGIMLLVFMPVPYVDASSSWAFRSRWHRAIVGAAGMYVELAVAAVAAIVWARTGETSTVHALAYNVLFIASVSTLLFNGNPLLRFDGYYILSDLLEIPNLSQRGKEYCYYLVKRYVYGVRNPRNPARSMGERVWLILYFVTSTVYRVFICIAILLFIADAFFVIGMLLAIAAVVTWVCLPVGAFVKYLATHAELARVRYRAVGLTLFFVIALGAAIGAVPFPDRARAHGVVEPLEMTTVHMGEAGFIDRILPTGTQVHPGGPALLSGRNRELEMQIAALEADRRGALARWRQAESEDVAVAEAFAGRLDLLDRRIEQMQRRLGRLEIEPPQAGFWILEDPQRLRGTYLPRGEPVGRIVNLDNLQIRVTADQHFGPRIEPEIGRRDVVDMRVQGRPGMRLSGTITRVLPAGQRRLPSAALGYHAGGELQIDPSDREGTRAAEPFFEIWIEPQDSPAARRLLSGQRVVARFETEPKPLAVQLVRAIRQMIQQRFQM
ncbi:MAG: PqqD family peptide modification chaperone [Phycisphaeraceae bacterium]